MAASLPHSVGRGRRVRQGLHGREGELALCTKGRHCPWRRLLPACVVCAECMGREVRRGGEGEEALRDAPPHFYGGHGNSLAR